MERHLLADSQPVFVIKSLGRRCVKCLRSISVPYKVTHLGVPGFQTNCPQMTRVPRASKGFMWEVSPESDPLINGMIGEKAEFGQ